MLSGVGFRGNFSSITRAAGRPPGRLRVSSSASSVISCPYAMGKRLYKLSTAVLIAPR